MGLFQRGAFAVCLMSMSAWSGAALAEDVILRTDQTSMMMLSADPGTVVIGNPGIADVTLNGKQLFLHGKAPGSTNLTILDTAGNKLANLDLIVANDYRNQVSVFSGAPKGAPARTTYTCVPDCEPAMVAGDSSAFLSATMADNSQRAAFATGVKKTNETEAPKPAQ
ncbi:MAG: pilus assembly protein N-terminal domain-containing protein [Aestuariivirga sp.]